MVRQPEQAHSLQSGSVEDEPLTAYGGVRTLVLGSTGFIGRWTSRWLSQLGAGVHAAVRDPDAAGAIFDRYGIEAEPVVVDLRQDGAVESLLRGVQPAVVFNLAGYGVAPGERDEATAFTINAELPRAVAVALSSLRHQHYWSGLRLVHVGSALEYGEVHGDLSEDSEPNPTTVYGRSKLAGTLAVQRVCRRKGVPAVTARLFTIYGPGEHTARLLPSLMRAAKNADPLQLTRGEQKRDFTYVEDAVEGLLRLGVSNPEYGEPVNLATGRLTSVRGFVEVAAAVLDIPAQRLQFGALPTRAEEMEHLPVNVARLKRLTSWKPGISIEEGVRRTLAFMRKYDGIATEPGMG